MTEVPCRVYSRRIKVYSPRTRVGSRARVATGVTVTASPVSTVTSPDWATVAKVTAAKATVVKVTARMAAKAETTRRLIEGRHRAYILCRSFCFLALSWF